MGRFSMCLRWAVLVFLFFPLFAIADKKGAEAAMDLVKSMCLAGSGFDMNVSGEGEISIVKKGVEGNIKFSERKLDGYVDVPDQDKHAEFESIRECTKPHIPDILQLLKEPAEVGVRQKGISETLVVSDFPRRQDMKAMGCEQAEADAIDKAKLKCSGKLYAVKIINCKANSPGSVTAYEVTIDATCVGGA